MALTTTVHEQRIDPACLTTVGFDFAENIEVVLEGELEGLNGSRRLKLAMVVRKPFAPDQAARVPISELTHQQIAGKRIDQLLRSLALGCNVTFVASTNYVDYVLGDRERRRTELPFSQLQRFRGLSSRENKFVKMAEAFAREQAASR